MSIYDSPYDSIGQPQDKMSQKAEKLAKKEETLIDPTIIGNEDYFKNLPHNQFQSEGEGVTEIDGNVFLNSNKIYNNDTPAQKQKLTSDFANSGYYWNPDDKTYRAIQDDSVINGKIGGVYHGNMGTEYEKAGYFTLDADSGLSPDEQLVANYDKFRKDPSLTGGYEPSRDGENMILLNDVRSAQAFEKYLHGNSENLEGRKYRLGDAQHLIDKADRSYTEIVKNGSIWGDTSGAKVGNELGGTQLGDFKPSTLSEEQRYQQLMEANSAVLGDTSRGFFETIGDLVGQATVGASRSLADTAKIGTDLAARTAYEGAYYKAINDGKDEATAEKEANAAADKIAVIQAKDLEALENDVLGYKSQTNKTKAMEETAKHYEKFVKDVELTDVSSWDEFNLSEGLAMLGSAFQNWDATAYSLGYTAAFMFGLPERAIGKVVGKSTLKVIGDQTLKKSASKSLAKLEKDSANLLAKGTMTEAELTATKEGFKTQIAKATEELNKASTKDKLKAFVTKNSNELHLGAITAQQDLDEYYEKYGERASVGHVILGVAANTVGAKLEIAADKLALMGTKNGIAEAIQTLGKDGSYKFIKAMTKPAAKLVEGGVAEFPAEYVQSWIQGFDSTYKDGNLTEALTEAKDQAILGAIQGFASGVHMATPRAGFGVVSDVYHSLPDNDSKDDTKAKESPNVELQDFTQTVKAMTPEELSVSIGQAGITNESIKAHIDDIHNGGSGTLPTEHRVLLKEHLNRVIEESSKNAEAAKARIKVIEEELTNIPEEDKETRDKLANEVELLITDINNQETQQAEAAKQSMLYDTDGGTLNNRPLTEIDTDLANIDKQIATTENPSVQLLANKKLLEIEKLIAESGIVPHANVDGVQVSPNEKTLGKDVETMKIYGGVDANGHLFTGAYQYAKALLSPTLKAREPLKNDFSYFRRSQRNKLDVMENAKAQAEEQGLTEDYLQEHPITVTYATLGNQVKEFKYYGKKSDNFIYKVAEEVKLLDDINNKVAEFEDTHYNADTTVNANNSDTTIEQPVSTEPQTTISTFDVKPVEQEPTIEVQGTPIELSDNTKPKEFSSIAKSYSTAIDAKLEKSNLTKTEKTRLKNIKKGLLKLGVTQISAFKYTEGSPEYIKAVTKFKELAAKADSILNKGFSNKPSNTTKFQTMEVPIQGSEDETKEQQLKKTKEVSIDTVLDPLRNESKETITYIDSEEQIQQKLNTLADLGSDFTLDKNPNPFGKPGRHDNMSQQDIIVELDNEINKYKENTNEEQPITRTEDVRNEGTERETTIEQNPNPEEEVTTESKPEQSQVAKDIDTVVELSSKLEENDVEKNQVYKQTIEDVLYKAKDTLVPDELLSVIDSIPKRLMTSNIQIIKKIANTRKSINNINKEINKNSKEVQGILFKYNKLFSKEVHKVWKRLKKDIDIYVREYNKIDALQRKNKLTPKEASSRKSVLTRKFNKKTKPGTFKSGRVEEKLLRTDSKPTIDEKHKFIETTAKKEELSSKVDKLVTSTNDSVEYLQSMVELLEDSKKIKIETLKELNKSLLPTTQTAESLLVTSKAKEKKLLADINEDFAKIMEKLPADLQDTIGCK